VLMTVQVPLEQERKEARGMSLGAWGMTKEKKGEGLRWLCSGWLRSQVDGHAGDGLELRV
jgi:hypothetical protein